jgi:hypothetical protein
MPVRMVLHTTVNQFVFINKTVNAISHMQLSRRNTMYTQLVYKQLVFTNAAMQRIIQLITDVCKCQRMPYNNIESIG